MHEIRIALLQMTACGTDQTANRDKGEEFVRRAKAMGADIALFPEMWNVGYAPFEGSVPNSGNIWRSPDDWDNGKPAASQVDPEIRRRWQDQAVARDSPFVEHFRALARELDIAIALTYLERWDGPPRNTCP